MLRAAFVTASFLIAPMALYADQADTDRLLDAMGIDGIVEIMRDEGLAYGDELALQATPDGATDSWTQAMAKIYDTDRMIDTVRGGFSAEIGDTDISTLIDFFESDGGKQLVSLELSARAAMTDEAVEDAAKDAYRAQADKDNPRLKQIDAFVDVNDLIESNVVGALNSNIVFYQGLADGGASQQTDEEILRDVWQQEDETRKDTREWVYGFLLMAYKPLDDKVLDDYIVLSGTEAGEALNRALFGGFDKMYSDISYALGRALAREMLVEEL